MIRADHESLILLMEEILHLSIGSFGNYLQGFIRSRWCKISSINSMLKRWFCSNHCEDI